MAEKPVIVIASYPRSGNTFVRQILWEAFGCRSHTAYPDEHITNEYGDHLSEADTTADPVVFIKTHNTTERAYPVWHIVRDGRDAVTSYRKMASKADLNIDDWQNCVTALNDIAAVTTKYEDLIKDPVGEVQRALKQFKVDGVVKATGADLTSFDELHQRAPSFWRRGKVGSHCDEMDDVGEFERANHRALQQFGYVA